MCEGHAGQRQCSHPSGLGITQFQWHDHHMSSLPQKWIDLSFNDLHLEWAKAHIFSHDDWFIHSCLYWGRTGSHLLPFGGVTSFVGCSNSKPPPQRATGTAMPLPKGQKVHLALSDDTFYSANRASPYYKWNPPREFRLIGNHEEHPVISLTCTWRIMKPSGLVCHPPKPTRFSG